MDTTLGTDDEHERNLWRHISSMGTHKKVLCDIFSKYSLNRPAADAQETAFTLYGMALAHKERQGCPIVGLATDRRTLTHVGEVFQQTKGKTDVFYLQLQTYQS